MTPPLKLTAYLQASGFSTKHLEKSRVCPKYFRIRKTPLIVERVVGLPDRRHPGSNPFVHTRLLSPAIA